MQAIKSIVAIGLLFFFTGCASMFSHREYAVTLNSQPQGAKVEVYQIKFRNQTPVKFTEGVTPCTLTFPVRAGFFRRNHYLLKFNRTGYSPVEQQLDPTISKWYWVNIVNIFFGDLCMGVIDPATGKMWTLPASNPPAVLSPSAP